MIPAAGMEAMSRAQSFVVGSDSQRRCAGASLFSCGYVPWLSGDLDGPSLGTLQRLLVELRRL